MTVKPTVNDVLLVPSTKIEESPGGVAFGSAEPDDVQVSEFALEVIFVLWLARPFAVSPPLLRKDSDDRS